MKWNLLNTNIYPPISDWTDLDGNPVYIGFKGEQYLNVGYIYAPYIPTLETPLVTEEDFMPGLNREELLSRYAETMVRPEYYGIINPAGDEVE